jgi:hypothetical protein
MKMLAYLLAVAFAVVAVMYYVMPGGSLPIFMPGYNAGSTHIYTITPSPPSQRLLFFC